jgi:hypothetical protein
MSDSFSKHASDFSLSEWEAELRARLSWGDPMTCGVEEVVTQCQPLYTDLKGNISAFTELVSYIPTEGAVHALLGLSRRGRRAIGLSFVVHRAIAIDCARDLEIMADAGLSFEDSVLVQGRDISFAEEAQRMRSPRALRFFLEKGLSSGSTVASLSLRANWASDDKCAGVLARHSNFEAVSAEDVDRALASPKEALQSLSEEALYHLFAAFRGAVKECPEREAAMLRFLAHMDFSRTAHIFSTALLFRAMSQKEHARHLQKHPVFLALAKVLAVDDAAIKAIQSLDQLNRRHGYTRYFANPFTEG